MNNILGDLSVKRFKIVTVHSDGETYDDLRETPKGEFCRYADANFNHKEYTNEVLNAAFDLLNTLEEVLQFIEDEDAYLKAESAILRAKSEG